MATLTTDAIASAVTFSVQSKVLENLRAELVFADPKFAESGTFDRGTDAIMFLSYADLSTATTPLTEGSPPTAQSLTQSSVTVDTNQFALAA